MERTPYDLSDGELIDRFGNLALIVGTASFETFPAKRLEKIYFFGACLARMQGQVPPFNQGDAVREKVAGNGTEAGIRVERVYYFGDGQWSLRFKNDSRSYPAGEFELMLPEETRAAA